MNSNSSDLEWNGERYVPQLRGTIALEHLHRYAYASEYVKGKVVLDIASGEGYGSDMLSRIAKHVYGVDIDEESVRHAQAKYQAKNLKYIIGSCTEIPLPDASVDVVVSFETIEHITDHDRMMCEVKRVLRPGGSLIISSPEKSVYDNINEQPNPFHLKELSGNEFQELLSRHFKHIALLGQRVILGSALVGLDGKSSLARTYEFSALPKKINSKTGLPKPIYIIAICSDEPIKNQSGSLCEQNIWEHQYCVDLAQTVADLEATVSQRDSQLAERDQWLIDAKLAIDERDERLIQAAHEIDQQISQNNQLREVAVARDVRIGGLTEAIAGKDRVISEKDREIGVLGEIVANRDGQIIGLHSQLTAKEEVVEAKDREISERALEIGVLGETVANRDGQIIGLHSQLTAREEAIAAKDRVISEKDLAIGVLGETVANRDGQIIGLQGQLTAREEAIAAKDRVISEKDREIEVQKESVANREGIIRELQSQLTEKERVITEMNNRIIDIENQLLEKKEALAGLYSEFNGLRESLSWRVTHPLGFVADKLKSVAQALCRYHLAAWIIWSHRKTGIFDPEWYALRYPDVRKSGMNPFWHFVMYGVYEGRAPHGLFTEDNYKLLNPDISGCGAMHYIIHGWREGRNIQVLFDKDFYLEKNKDVKKSGVDPVIHYLKFGFKEGRRPHLHIDQNFYIDSYKDIKECGIEPLSHYLHWGWKESRRIIPLFDTNYYLKHNQDIRDSGMEPLTHYMIAGGGEGRNPNAIFNAKKVLKRVPKTEETSQNPLSYYIDGKWDKDPSPEQTLFLAMVENDI
jgi:SAM-dependent methyltransferase